MIYSDYFLQVDQVRNTQLNIKLRWKITDSFTDSFMDSFTDSFTDNGYYIGHFTINYKRNEWYYFLPNLIKEGLCLGRFWAKSNP